MQELGNIEASARLTRCRRRRHQSLVAVWGRGTAGKRARAKTTLRPLRLLDWTNNLDGIKRLLDETRKGGGPPIGIVPPEAPKDPSPQPLEGRSGMKSNENSALPKPPEGGPAVVTVNKEKVTTSNGGHITLQPPEGQSDDISTRAKLYILKKKKEEAVAALKKCLGEKISTYEAVLSLTSGDRAAPTLQGGALLAAEDTGSFFSSGDGRISRCYLATSLSEKKTVSYSFQPKSFLCSCCEVNAGHRVFNHRQEEAEAREVIFLTDQSYPACLPSMNKNKCIISIRVENGGMRELLKELLEATVSTKLAAGTVILLFSISHLAAVGTAAYIDDLAAMRRFIKKARGEGVLVGALPPLVSCVSSSPTLNRQLREVSHWMLNQDPRDECSLIGATKAAMDILVRSASGNPVASAPERLRMQANMNESGKKCFVSSN